MIDKFLGATQNNCPHLYSADRQRPPPQGVGRSRLLVLEHAERGSSSRLDGREVLFMSRGSDLAGNKKRRIGRVPLPLEQVGREEVRRVFDSTTGESVGL